MLDDHSELLVDIVRKCNFIPMVSLGSGGMIEEELFIHLYREFVSVISCHQEETFLTYCTNMFYIAQMLLEDEKINRDKSVSSVDSLVSLQTMKEKNSIKYDDYHSNPLSLPSHQIFQFLFLAKRKEYKRLANLGSHSRMKLSDKSVRMCADDISHRENSSTTESTCYFLR